MNNYKLVKNTEWKEVEINGQIVEIPNDWDIQKIGEKIQFNRGGTPIKNEENYSGDLPWITISNLTEKYISSYTAKIKKEKNTKIFKRGTLLGSFKMSVGRFAFATEECSTNEGIMGFYINESIHNPNYLYYTFPNLFIANALPNQQGVLLLNTDIINNIEFICPALKVQSSIASILSAQESIIQDIESLISKYESRFQYLSEELLSGKLRVKEVDGQTVLYKNPEDNWKEVEINGEMKEIPKDWEVLDLKGNVSIRTGKKDANFATFNGEYSFFTCGKEILKANSYSFDCEAILIAGNGDVGETKYYNGKFEAYQRTYILSEYKYNLKFLYFYINILFKNTINILGSAMPYIKLGDLENFSIKNPGLKEEKLILKVFENQNNLIEQQKQLLVKEKQKFNWLLENLLSGKYLTKEKSNE